MSELLVRNKPIDFPDAKEFEEKWLNYWSDDLQSESKLKEISDRCISRIKKLSPLERRNVLCQLIGYIDLTTLSGDDTRQRVYDLVDKAISPLQQNNDSIHCAAVCVYPARVPDVVERLSLSNAHNKSVGIASVAGGFPSGQYRLESRLLEVQLAVADGATEIDTVINRAAALDSDWPLLHHELKMMRSWCGNKAHIKTILATGELGSMKRIYISSIVAMMAGSDFIKTSTGKETVNATLAVSYVMCKAIRHYWQITGIKVGFKPAGGIRTADDALSYYFLIDEVLGEEWKTWKLFRIGASTLLDNIVNELEKQ